MVNCDLGKLLLSLSLNKFILFPISIPSIILVSSELSHFVFHVCFVPCTVEHTFTEGSMFGRNDINVNGSYHVIRD